MLFPSRSPPPPTSFPRAGLRSRARGPNDGRKRGSRSRKVGRQRGALRVHDVRCRGHSGRLDAAGADEGKLLRVFIGRVGAGRSSCARADPEPRGRELALSASSRCCGAIIRRAWLPPWPSESWVGPLDGIRDFEIGAGPWRSRPHCRWQVSPPGSARSSSSTTPRANPSSWPARLAVIGGRTELAANRRGHAPGDQGSDGGQPATV